jgi:hypothetical protein
VDDAGILDGWPKGESTMIEEQPEFECSPLVRNDKSKVDWLEVATRQIEAKQPEFECSPLVRNDKSKVDWLEVATRQIEASVMKESEKMMVSLLREVIREGERKRREKEEAVRLKALQRQKHEEEMRERNTRMIEEEEERRRKEALERQRREENAKKVAQMVDEERKRRRLECEVYYSNHWVPSHEEAEERREEHARKMAQMVDEERKRKRTELETSEAEGVCDQERKRRRLECEVYYSNHWVPSHEEAEERREEHARKVAQMVDEERKRKRTELETSEAEGVCDQSEKRRRLEYDEYYLHKKRWVPGHDKDELWQNRFGAGEDAKRREIDWSGRTCRIRNSIVPGKNVTVCDTWTELISPTIVINKQSISIIHWDLMYMYKLLIF